MAAQSFSSGSSIMKNDTLCHCKRRVVMKTSRTRLNPGRRFLCCPIKDVALQCSFFDWVDPEIQPSSGDADEVDSKLNFWIEECYQLQKYLEEDLRRIRMLEDEIKHLKAKDSRKHFIYRACFGVFVYVLFISFPAYKW